MTDLEDEPCLDCVCTSLIARDLVELPSRFSVEATFVDLRCESLIGSNLVSFSMSKSVDSKPLSSELEKVRFFDLDCHTLDEEFRDISVFLIKLLT